MATSKNDALRVGISPHHSLCPAAGPCVPTNTACSSSLVAVHLATASLHASECSFAAAAGANAILLPQGASAAMMQVRALAPDGRCKAFGAEGDGYGRGEGFAVVVLEQVSLDVAGSSRHAHALLAGSTVNQDGRSSGLTAPHGPSQTALVSAAMSQAGITALGYVASHGTGTPLGDPIESGALRRCVVRDGVAFMHAGAPGNERSSAPVLPADYVFTVGAVKTLTGHLEGSAGLAGLLQALVVLRERAVAPLRYRNINPYVRSSMDTWEAACR